MKKYIFITTLGLLFFLGGFLYLRRLIIELPDLASLDEFRPVLVTRLFDRKGAVIDELFIERRALVPLSSIPVDLQNAIISVEDTDFFRHWGINLRGIFRAFVKN
ncbi:MAG TPA: transglycosylase domain-containing protein, partial [bacterium]|nr:transglycosylase domain-containing protein [bacterium]